MIHFGWGLHAIRSVASDYPIVVVVDVLSFSTSVDIAVSRGAAVLPYRFDDPGAAAFAANHDATLATGRGEETPERPFSLSPLTMGKAQRGDRIVLPSPNGATLSLEAAGGAAVIAGSLRNASAVAAHAAALGGHVAVIAAGERWPDGSLRPAVEDLLGAGAIVSALGRSSSRSPEAVVAAAAFRGAGDPAALIHASASGQELVGRGHGHDVEVATDQDASTSVPVLIDGEYRGAEH